MIWFGRASSENPSNGIGLSSEPSSPSSTRAALFCLLRSTSRDCLLATIGVWKSVVCPCTRRQNCSKHWPLARFKNCACPPEASPYCRKRIGVGGLLRSEPSSRARYGAATKDRAADRFDRVPGFNLMTSRAASNGNSSASPAQGSAVYLFWNCKPQPSG